MLLVFDDEHGATDGGAPDGLRRGGAQDRRHRQLLFERSGGQINSERRSLSDAALDVDKSPVVLDDAVRDRKPEAGAFAGLLGGKKGLEDAPAYRLVHSLARIRDLDDEISLLRGAAAVGARRLGDFGPERQSAPAR